ncbi:hypothetical protein [Nocardioides sp.]|uniref:hypothetical protein n=1 Tax=Nocardioides sp. TaxID=35761 RepID=UPI003D1495CB
MVEHIASHEFGVCPGEHGPREQLLADARWRAGMEREERFLAMELEHRRNAG